LRSWCVPQNFLYPQRDQPLLLPVDMREWLPEDDLVYVVLDAVATLDLGEFRRQYRADGHGRAAFDPEMMVALLLYGYCQGERSSRVIERRCVRDVAYRVITGGLRPDHATIARFRARHETALGRLFSQVLRLLAAEGMVSLGTGCHPMSAHGPSSHTASACAVADGEPRRGPSCAVRSTPSTAWVPRCGRSERAPS
jgi:transposase